MSSGSSIGRFFAAIDALFRGIRDGLSGIGQRFRDPLVELAFIVVVSLTGVRVVAEDVLTVADRWVARFERAAVTFGLGIMTFLAFNEYLQRELAVALDTDLYGIWNLDGQMNLALLMLIVVGFLGASLATREGKHITVDAVARVLSPGPARMVKRLTQLASASLCFLFARGSWDAVFNYSRDAFEGVKVWWWMTGPINALTAWMPGEKFGVGTAFPDVMDWEDAKYDAGLDPFEMTVFGFVEAGDRFPLWVPMLFMVFAFGIMGARFLAGVFQSSVPGEGPSSIPTRRPADVILAGLIPGALLTMLAGSYFGQGVLIIFGALMLIILGAPLFVGIGVGTMASWLLLRNGSPETVINDMFEATKKQELLAIPFFVLAGNIMTEGSIARRLIDIARIALGSIPGGLGAGAVLACAFFAAISGSSPVTVIAIGSIIFPMLIEEGYDEKYSMGVLTSAGSLGIIIPPSIPMLVYAIIVSNNPVVGVVDPTDLFKAGILPGLFIATVLICWTFYVSWPRDANHVELRKPYEGSWGAAMWRALIRGLPSLMLPVIVLGGIYGWVDLTPLGIDFKIAFTVTEAAAVAVVYALFVELLINRELSVRELPKVFSDSAVMMGSLFLVLVIAISLNRFFVFEQIPEQATAWMLEHVDSQLTFLLMVNLFLLALGCVMDILSAILIVAPLLAPIAASYGIDKIHFAIMFIVNLELGYLTPLMGINLFVASTVFERPILDVIRAVVPFLLLMLFCLVVIVAFPSLSLALL
jgi:C4-dicarboxylate transporter DctM subunit